jgi:hypothetical protein
MTMFFKLTGIQKLFDSLFNEQWLFLTVLEGSNYEPGDLTSD